MPDTLDTAHPTGQWGRRAPPNSASPQASNDHFSIKAAWAAWSDNALGSFGQLWYPVTVVTETKSSQSSHSQSSLCFNPFQLQLHVRHVQLNLFRVSPWSDLSWFRSRWTPAQVRFLMHPKCFANLFTLNYLNDMLVMEHPCGGFLKWCYATKSSKFRPL